MLVGLYIHIGCALIVIHRSASPLSPESHILAEIPESKSPQVPDRYSGYTPDEIALALRLSRATATGRLMMARTLATDLPGTLAAWQAGTQTVAQLRAALARA
ncbi:MAG: hypothetical protein ACRDTT_32235, partial [Pseudonocardiaceae bacterium]